MERPHSPGSPLIEENRGWNMPDGLTHLRPESPEPDPELNDYCALCALGPRRDNTAETPNANRSRLVGLLKLVIREAPGPGKPGPSDEQAKMIGKYINEVCRTDSRQWRVQTLSFCEKCRDGWYGILGSDPGIVRSLCSPHDRCEDAVLGSWHWLWHWYWAEKKKEERKTLDRIHSR